jgi:hypothetical protein
VGAGVFGTRNSARDGKGSEGTNEAIRKAQSATSEWLTRLAVQHKLNHNIARGLAHLSEAQLCRHGGV